MTKHRVVDEQQWLEERRALLHKEKELNRLRDEISQARRALPWTKIHKDYRFDDGSGSRSLAALFQGRSQLIVYHFMFDPEWEAGCKSCSYLADHFDGAIPHLQQRDVSFAVVSRAPIDKLLAFRERMGWGFDWLSSSATSFNEDFHVSFPGQEGGKIDYNYHETDFFSTETPGLSVFYRDEDGRMYHCYSTYARGLDLLIGTYNFLDLVPRGRDEHDLPFTMAWVKHHDQY